MSQEGKPRLSYAQIFAQPKPLTIAVLARALFAAQGAGVMMKLDAIVVGDRVRKDMGDLEALSASIQRHGLLHPVVVKKDRTLVAGHRRLEAVRNLGWDEIPVTVIDVDDLLCAERDENTERKDFTPTEAVAIGRLIEERERPLAQERLAQGRIKGGLVRQGKVDADSTPTKKNPVRDIAARAVGLNPSKYGQAKAIVEAAEADPESFGDLPAHMDDTGNVNGAHREMKRRKGTAKKISLSKTGKNIERIQEAQFRAGIWEQVRGALVNLTSLPDAVEVVAIVRAHARDKTLVDKKLKPAINWLREFSDGWSKGNGQE